MDYHRSCESMLHIMEIQSDRIRNIFPTTTWHASSPAASIRKDVVLIRNHISVEMHNSERIFQHFQRKLAICIVIKTPDLRPVFRLQSDARLSVKPLLYCCYVIIGPHWLNIAASSLQRFMLLLCYIYQIITQHWQYWEFKYGTCKGKPC